MKNSDFSKRLESLGYPLFDLRENVDANKTLAEVVTSGNLRLWEGFPLVLLNSFQRGLFNYRAAEKFLKTAADKTLFRKLLVMSTVLYEYLRLDLSLRRRLKEAVPFDKKLFCEFLKRFEDGADLSAGTGRLSSVRVVNIFKRYSHPEQSNVKEYVEMKSELDLEYSLSQMFSKKQKELFMKRLKGEKMTKTEREYYSRTVRKKVLALANPELHKLAVTLSNI